MTDETHDFRSGFVTFVGRPNVGKSSLVNSICGRKVSIVSDKPQTTRHRIMGVLTRPDEQIVFVDTPGLHKPVSALGERVNATALGSVSDVDATCLVLDATMPFGKGDRWVAEKIHMPDSVVIVNKTDVASRKQVMAMLQAASVLGAAEYFPVSAKPATESAHSSITSARVSRPARSTSPTTRCPISPRSDGWPSWCASNSWRSPVTNFRIRSPRR